VSHPNVCRVYDIADHEGQQFLTMEFVDGEDLASLLKRVGRLSEEKAIDVARQLCASLAAVHDQGLLHRDLKPANVMLDGRGRVRLTDFGLAAAEASVSGVEVRFGTPSYQAPEQAAGKEVTIRSDVYALGLILYELVTGKRAYPDAGRDTPPTPVSTHVAGLNPAIDRIISRCLAHEPEKRPQSAAAVLAALPGGDPLAEAVAAGVTPSPEVVAAASVVGQLPVARGVAVLVSVIVGLAVFIHLYDRVMLVGMVGLPEPTDALGRRARDVFLLAGLEDRADAVGFDHDQEFLHFAFDPHDKSSWAEWIEKRSVAPIFFWCRQTPTPFAPDLFYPYAGSLEPPRVSWSDPAPIVPGMAAAKVDVHGRLLTFISIPPEREKQLPPAQKEPADEHWRRWFHRADLDFHRFTPVTPEWVPPMHADTRYAWLGPPVYGDALPIRVEAATFRGKVVSFTVLAPWTKRDIGAPTQGVGGQGASVSQLELFVPILVAIFILAPRNLRTGRADGVGAFRVAWLVFLIQMTVWLCETRHMVESYAAFRLEIRSLVLGLAFALYWAALLGGAYLALEPLVRRWWPEAVVSWTRLLAGRWNDPLVGRDLLTGVFGGVLLTVVAMFGNLLPNWLGEPASIPWWDWWVPNTRVPGYWTGTLLMALVYSFRTAFFYNLLLLVLLRQLLGRPALYATAFVVIWTILKAHDQELLTSSPGGWLSVVLGVAFLVLGNLIMYGMLVRYGALAVIVAAFVVNSLWFPMTLEVNAGVTHSGVLILIGIISIASFGFYTACLANREPRPV
ncbi:MAG: serine/threonine-protein kinase, partial [Gemmataceae bacterium]